MSATRSRHPLAPLLLLGACSLSPLANRIDVGEEAFLVFVATGPDGLVDLHAMPAGGGTVARITFTPMVESHPALTSRGDVLAFLRGGDSAAMVRPDLVVMNLLNGAERTLPLPAAVGAMRALAWGPGDTTVVVRTDTDLWQVAAPPAPATATRLAGAARAIADSALATWLGRPRFARAFNCPAGLGVCLVGPSGDTTVLASRGRDPFRWGADSVGWFEGDALFVRSLGPATARSLSLGPRPPTALGQATFATP